MPNGRLPSAIVIGSPRAGTTSLCEGLASHPNIWMLPKKEARFFDAKYKYGIEWYRSLFQRAPADAFIMEGTPGYTEGKKSAVTASRIAATLPTAKLIYIVRHPIDRLVSHYVQTVENGYEPKPLETAVEELPFLVETSLYAERLEDYLKHFDREQIKVIFLRDICSKPNVILNEVLQFLGLPLVNEVKLPHVNTRETRQVDRKLTNGLMQSLRSNKTYMRLNHLVPRSVIGAVKPLVRKPLQVDGAITDKGRLPASVHMRIREDSKRFLEMVGHEADVWRFEE